MADFVTLTCPSCGGKLQITSDLDRFACGYCGTEHVVRRGGGVVSLAPVVEGLKEVKVGVDKTASELAIQRLRQDIAELEKRKKEIGEVGAPKALFTIAGLVAFGLGLWGFLADRSSLCIWGVVLLAVAFVLLVWHMSAQVKPIDNALAQKRAELAKHEKLVSG
jgi:hypothetical protein